MPKNRSWVLNCFQEAFCLASVSLPLIVCARRRAQPCNRSADLARTKDAAAECAWRHDMMTSSPPKTPKTVRSIERRNQLPEARQRDTMVALTHCCPERRMGAWVHSLPSDALPPEATSNRQISLPVATTVFATTTIKTWRHYTHLRSIFPRSVWHYYHSVLLLACYMVHNWRLSRLMQNCICICKLLHSKEMF